MGSGAIFYLIFIIHGVLNALNFFHISLPYTTYEDDLQMVSKLFFFFESENFKLRLFHVVINH